MFTKGEWKVFKGAKNVSERVPPEGRNDFWNTWVVDENDLAIAQIHSNDDEKLIANANLIAAAPELYQVLNDLYDSDLLERHYEYINRGIGTCTKNGIILVNIKKALAKAEGK